jgi:hypothetical protein
MQSGMRPDRWLRVALAVVAICGVLAHWGIKANYHFRGGGWPAVWGQEFYGFANTKCMSCWITLYIVGWLYICMPYFIVALGGLLLRSSVAIAVLIALTFGLIYEDVDGYFKTSSKDWYVALSSLINTALAIVCVFIAWLVGKAFPSKARGAAP